MIVVNDDTDRTMSDGGRLGVHCLIEFYSEDSHRQKNRAAVFRTVCSRALSMPRIFARSRYWVFNPGRRK
jgi:hypothetical protein